MGSTMQSMRDAAEAISELSTSRTDRTQLTSRSRLQSGCHGATMARDPCERRPASLLHSKRRVNVPPWCMEKRARVTIIKL